jgi:hypothetical protein
VTERDRAVVRVHLRRVEVEVAHHGEGLSRERLVQLDHVDVFERLAGSLARPPHRRYGQIPIVFGTSRRLLR